MSGLGWRDPTKCRLKVRGATIHRLCCNRARRATPWLWADDKTDAEVLTLAVNTYGYRECRVCRPLAAEARRDT